MGDIEYERYQWFCDVAPSKELEAMLVDRGQEGEFFVRPSSSVGAHVLVCKTEGIVKSFKIINQHGMFFVTDSRQFPSIDLLVSESMRKEEYSAVGFKLTRPIVDVFMPALAQANRPAAISVPQPTNLKAHRPTAYEMVELPPIPPARKSVAELAPIPPPRRSQPSTPNISPAGSQIDLLAASQNSTNSSPTSKYPRGSNMSSSKPRKKSSFFCCGGGSVSDDEDDSMLDISKTPNGGSHNNLNGRQIMPRQSASSMSVRGILPPPPLPPPQENKYQDDLDNLDDDLFGAQVPVENFLYYHGDISRDESERRLSRLGVDGCYLVRRKNEDTYVITVWYKRVVAHGKVDKSPAGWVFDPNLNPFPSIPKLISYYHKNGMEFTEFTCLLTKECPRP